MGGFVVAGVAALGATAAVAGVVAWAAGSSALWLACAVETLPTAARATRVAIVARFLTNVLVMAGGCSGWGSGGGCGLGGRFVTRVWLRPVFSGGRGRGGSRDNKPSRPRRSGGQGDVG